MSTHTARRPAPAASPAYAPPAAPPAVRPAATASSHALIAEAIDCIIHGRAFPEHLRPRAFAPPRPATVQEGIARILGG